MFCINARGAGQITGLADGQSGDQARRLLITEFYKTAMALITRGRLVMMALDVTILTAMADLAYPSRARMIHIPGSKAGGAGMASVACFTRWIGI